MRANEEEMWAVDVLASAREIHKFTETVWLCVDRHAWDQFCKTQGAQNVSERVLQTQD
jgi:hypothetical protein